MGIEQPGEFAGIGKANADGGAGEVGEPGAAEEALDIDDQVIAVAPQIALEAKQIASGGWAVPGSCPTFALEAQKAQGGQAFDNAGTCRGDQPGNAGLRIALAEQVPERQCVNHITD